MRNIKDLMKVDYIKYVNGVVMFKNRNENIDNRIYI